MCGSRKLIICCLLWCRMLSATPLGSYSSDEDLRLLQWIRSPRFLQMEFFTMASGSYLAFPAAHREPREEATFHAISRSVSHLWTQLSSMREIDRTIETVTQEVSSIMKDLLHYRNAVNFVCQKIDTILGDDPTLGPKYVTLKRNVSNSIRPMENIYFWRSLDEIGTLPADKMASWLADKQIRRLLLNGDFLNYIKRPANSTETDERDFWLTAQSVLQISNSEQAERVQRLYDEVLTEAAAEINADLDFRQPTLVLFEKLEKKFHTNDLLGDRFASAFSHFNATIV